MMTIDTRAALRIVAQHAKGALVVDTMMGARAWSDVTPEPQLQWTIDVMGKAADAALGFALAQPRRKVIVIDGDGSILSNMGGLTTVAQKAPHNLVHLLLYNGMYAVTGGQPIPAQKLVDFVEMAKRSGYPSAYAFDDLEEWAANARRVLSQDGPTFVSLAIRPEIINQPIKLRPPRKSTGVNSWPRVRQGVKTNG